MNALIIYHTKTGHTLEAVTPIADGLKSKNVTAEIVLAKELNSEKINDAEIIVFGTPCWGGSSGITGVATPIQKAIKKLDKQALANKICVGVAVHAKNGGEATLKHLEKLLSAKGCKQMIKAPVAKAGVLTSIIKGKSVSKDATNQLFEFAKTLV